MTRFFFVNHVTFYAGADAKAICIHSSLTWGRAVSARSFAVDGGGAKDMGQKINPRYHNGTLRRKHRARFKAMGAPCGICRGRLGPIHYDEPSNAQHPLSFVIDEIKPISKWEMYGYASPAAAAQDWNNLQPAHYWCNAQKGAKINYSIGGDHPIFLIEKNDHPPDGEW